MTTQPHYDALEALIRERGWWFATSEVHGMQTALVACGSGARWPEILFAQGGTDTLAREAFDRLAAQIEATLAGDALDYQLLLPEEGTLSARAEALVAWAQGFTVATRWLAPTLDDDCRAFLADLDEIGKLDDRLADSEENRQMLTGLEEHCRMGALMLYAYCHKPHK
ncbi:UPF0149 family protein [uncultured Cardiobacterium sp.]|uniref:UPF0149 family protein n=1 Tax=uncultured Cardiobacterium sp. TaxID=417619 RepID=UPI0026199250|nr:UPF0149 family protein [uncultured Cardiobacterium sp.]